MNGTEKSTEWTIRWQFREIEVFGNKRTVQYCTRISTNREIKVADNDKVVRNISVLEMRGRKIFYRAYFKAVII